MTTRTRVWIGGVVVLALVAIALPSLVTAQYRGGGNPGNPSSMTAPAGFRMGNGPAWIDVLDLGEEQREQLAALRLDFQQAQLRTRGQIAAAQAELDALLLDPEATRSAVQSAGSAVQKLRDQGQTQRLSHQMDVRELLTPEQRMLLVQMEARRGGGGPGLQRGAGRHACLQRSDRSGGRGPHGGNSMHSGHPGHPGRFGQPMPSTGPDAPEPEDAPDNEGI